MKTKTMRLTLAVLIFAGLIYLALRNKVETGPNSISSPVGSASHPPENARLVLPPSDQVAGMPEPDSTSAASNTNQEDDPNLPPENPIDREDLARNARMSPHGLIAFTHQLAAQMQEAMENEKAAAPLFSQLEDCVSDKNGKQITQARMICLANASILSKQYPDSLKGRFKSLANQYPDLAEAMESSGIE